MIKLRKKLNKCPYIVAFISVILMLTAFVGSSMAARQYSALENRNSKIANAPNPHNYIRMPDVAAPSDALTDTPASGWAFLYMDGDELIFKDDSGSTTTITSASTATLNDVYDNGATINVDTAGVNMDIDLANTTRE